MARAMAGHRGIAPWICAALCFALFVPAQICVRVQKAPAKGQPRRETVSLTGPQRLILDHARNSLKGTSLPDAEQQLRLSAIEAAMTGTAAVPDEDNPEVRNASLWTLTNRGYVVAARSTAVEAIDDLWVVHDGDDVPVPRIWCYKYSSLVIVKAYIQYFHNSGNDAGLAAICNLIGHKIFPDDLPNEGEGVFWKERAGGADLLPGDQVWFQNPFFARGRELIRQRLYEEALSDGKSAEEAATVAQNAADDAAAGEQGANVFYVGDNQVSRGAVSVVRAFCGGVSAASRPASPTYEQVYTRKIFTIPGYQQHIIDDFNTVQAYMEAHPGAVHPADFQIKRTRSLVNPETLLKSGSAANRPRRLDPLIDAMASRNKEPALAGLGEQRVPLFAEDYDWTEQGRVRGAILAVMKTRSDAMWWRLFDHRADKRYVLTASLKELAENVSLGSLCGDLAYADLCWAYARHLPAVPGRLPSTFAPEEVLGKNEKEWARAGKPVYEMQIEVCRRAIQQWASVKGTEPGKEGRPHTYTTDEKARFLAAVQKEIEDLRRTKRAVFVDAVLPAVTAPSGWDGFDAERAKTARDEYRRNVARACGR